MKLKEFWQRYRKNRAAVIGLFIASFFVLVSLIGPYISPFDPIELGDDLLVPPNNEHLMGTDNLGKDIYSQFLYGVRTSLLVGFLAAAIASTIGTSIGAISGYFGGKIDDLLMRITEVFMVIPRFFLALLIIAIFGTGIIKIIFVIGMLTWPTTARLVRSRFLSLKELEYVEAARALGLGDMSIIFKEILPNAADTFIVSTSLEVAHAILLESGLSFLGLGDPNTFSWGGMLFAAQATIIQAWWMAIFPGLGITLTCIGMNLIGDGLNDALNPKLKER